MLLVHLSIMRVYDVFLGKNELLCGLCKKEKINAKIRLLTRHLFVLFASDTKSIILL
jgi:hypothetical protein